MANTWTTDLIQRDPKGEYAFFRTKFYAEVFRALYDSWMPLYQNMYPLWGKTQIMVAKIFWDWGAYWSINTLLFTNNGLTDLELLKKVTAGPTSILQKYGELSTQMQRFFKDWMPHDTADISERYTDPFDLDFLKQFQEDIVEREFDRDELLLKFEENMLILEHIAAEMFHLASNQVHGTSMEIVIDLYTMSLSGEKKKSPNSKLVERGAHIADQMKAMWLYKTVKG